MPVAVGTGIWELDAARSSVAVRQKTMWGLVTVKVHFGAVSGEGEVLPDGSARGTLTVDTASLDTKHAKRDTHLRSADFFDVEQFPTLTFSVRGTKPGPDDTVQVTGDLTVRGVTRPQSFTAKVTASDAGSVTLDGELVLDRADFGLGWNQMGMIVGRTTAAATLRFTRVAG
jgi:polyisoprenoid-binding protein YceI